MATISDMLSRMELYDSFGNRYEGIRPSLINNPIKIVILNLANRRLVFGRTINELNVIEYKPVISVSMELGSTNPDNDLLTWKVEAHFENSTIKTFIIDVNGNIEQEVF